MLPLLCSTLLGVTGALAAPALITASSGQVLLDEQPAPAAPFLVPEGGRLELGPDGEVVVLSGGKARRLHGPGPADLAPPPDPPAGAAALEGLLQRQVDTSRAGATRSGGPVQLLRPVPGTRVLELRRVVWTCPDGCEVVEVELRPLAGGAAAWTGQGSGAVELPALELAPGPWVLRVGGVDHAVLVPPEDEQRALGAALQAGDAAAEALPDATGRASVRAAVRWQAGLPTAALAELDALGEAGAPLVAAWQARLGLAP